MQITIRLLIFILFLQILNGCIPRINIRKTNRSTVSLKSIQFEAVGRYPEPVVKFLMKKLKSPEKIEITSGIELFRVSYTTKDENDKSILVSGLLSIPLNKRIKGVVSYQHGTNNERSEVPMPHCPKPGRSWIHWLLWFSQISNRFYVIDKILKWQNLEHKWSLKELPTDWSAIHENGRSRYRLGCSVAASQNHDCQSFRHRDR